MMLIVLSALIGALGLAIWFWVLWLEDNIKTDKELWPGQSEEFYRNL